MLWDVLLRRYPFRLFPSLPPKRVGGEIVFPGTAPLNIDLERVRSG